MVFLLCASVYLIGFIVYSLIGSVELQSWAVIRDDNEVEMQDEKSNKEKSIRI